MVGEQIRKWFSLKKYEVFAYDKFKNIGKVEDLGTAELIFLCLPSAYDKKIKSGVDIGIFKETIKYFKEPKLFVVKSTVPPGTTDTLQRDFPKHKFFQSPEFLTEITAWEDFSKPTLQLLGYTGDNKKLAEKIIRILPKGKHTSILPVRVTETFKYARNAFFAVKVMFANQIYDFCQALGIDYEEMRKLMSEEPWIGGNHLQVLHKGYRGFGGKCLPKDLKTFIKSFKVCGVPPKLFEIVDKMNDRILKDQNLTDKLNRYWLNNSNS